MDIIGSSPASFLQVSDEALAEACKKHDQLAFQELMRRYIRQIFNFVRQYTRVEEDAEDVAQDTFFKAWKHIGQFKKGRAFKPWLYAIARNTALDFLKKRRATSFSSLDDEEAGTSFVDTVEDTEPLAPELFERAELATELADALGILHPDHRLVLILRYHQEMTFEEIASIVDKPMNTVKSWHHRALKKVSRQLTHRNQAILRIHKQ